LAVAVLILSAAGVNFAQSAQNELGALTGKLTDLHSNPLPGVTVILRNEATGAEASTTTATNGTYRFSGLEQGEYSLEARSTQLGHGRLDEIVVSAGHEARVQAAMEFEQLPPAPVLAALHEVEAHPVAERLQVQTPAPEPVALTVSKPALAIEQPQTAKRNVEPEKTLGQASGAIVPVVRTAPKAGPMVARLSIPAAGLVGAAPGVAIQVMASRTGNATAAAATRAALAAVAQIAQARYRPALDASQPSGPAAPAVTATMSAAELQALPVSGRHWQDFVLDNAPTSSTPVGGQGEIALRGAGQQRAGSTVDGASRELAFGSTSGSGHGSQGQGGEPAGMAQVGVGGHGFAVSETAIRAVETATGNMEAEAARAVGGRMNVETERGGEKLHGQGFVFDRQNIWGANNPFSQWVKEIAPANARYNSVPFFASQAYTPANNPSYTPADREMTWGIGLGSRIRRDRLFWFAAVDGSNRNDPGIATVKHACLGYDNEGVCTSGFFANPTSDQMQVLASRLGLSGSNAEAEGRARYSCMLETLAGGLGGSPSSCLLGTPLAPLLGPSPRTAQQWTGFARLDWLAAERHRFTLEGIGADWSSPGGGLTRVLETYGNHSFGSTKASEEWLLGRWEAFLTPNLLAVTQGSVGHDVQEARPSTPSAFEKTLLTGNAWNQLPQIVVDNRYGFTIGNPSRFGAGSYPDERLYQEQESVDWIRGKLLVRGGFDFSHNFDATNLLRNQTGTYTYSSVESFVSDALAVEQYGLSGILNPGNNLYGCDQTGKVWRDSAGGLNGAGNLPCYSYYSQTIGPTDWHLSTNDWAGYATTQWQAGKLLAVSAGLRWEREQLPPPIARLWPPPAAPNSPPGALPPQKLPSLGNNWGPRVSLAFGSGESRWPLLRLGYGMYFGRTQNSAVETALTQTGSAALNQNGQPAADLNFFLRPTDNLIGGGAPPFPYVLRGPPGSMIKPGAVEFAPNFHNPEVHQGIASLEEKLPGHIEVIASAMASLDRRLPLSIDANLAIPTPAQTITYAVKDATGVGPIKAAQITVPFYASWPSPTGNAGRPDSDYQQITQIMSRANSTYEAGVLRVARYGRRGLSINAHYTYAHAADWNPNESAQVAGSDVLEPGAFGLEYGTSDLDRRHSAGVTAIYEAPWKLRGLAGKLGNGWMLSGVGQARSGLPYTMRTSGSLAEEFLRTTNGTEKIVALGPGMNGSGGDNRVYGQGSDGRFYNIGRNTYRYPATWKADLRMAKRFDLGSMRQLELLAESFNLLNHQNVTEVETTGYTIEAGTTEGGLPTLNFLNGMKANTTAFGQPLNVNATNFYRERQFQFGLRLRF
jgi:hypothetical protein